MTIDLPFLVSEPPEPIKPSTIQQDVSDSSTTSICPGSQTSTPQHPQTILPHQNGGLLYNNLIPGHYSYGAKPPPPPPGPLSIDSSSHQQQILSQNMYSNIQNNHSENNIDRSVPSNRQVLQVSEPDEEDDDLFVIALEEDSDDEQLYRPFRHTSKVCSHGDSVRTKSDECIVSTQSNYKSTNKVTTNVQYIEPKPIDLLAVLLSGSSHKNSASKQSTNSNISVLIEKATIKSGKARSMTTALALKVDRGQATENKTSNELYVETANAHTEAALSFQNVYRSLLGVDDNNSAVLQKSVGRLCSSEELAKSMLILANGHVRMASSLADMGVKWNMGKAESFGIVTTNDTTKNSESSRDNIPPPVTVGNAERKHMVQHERIRLAVRGALDTAHHEEDITNSVFLARSTFLNKGKASKSNKIGIGGENENEHAFKENPIDDLMKLEKELKGMDMALEVGTSVSNLGTAVSSRPDGSFCLVPPGSSYMSSSFMWSSGVAGKVGSVGNQQQQHRQGDKVGLKSPNANTGVRYKANHLQNSVRPSINPRSIVVPAPTAQMQPNAKTNQTATSTGLDQSWWGGGQGSMMASVALSTVTASHEKAPTQTSSNPPFSRAELANTKQLMQLMDSLKRLGDENAQLMREVEDAKAARSEAEAAKNMMEKFKIEYSQRFLKVREALEKVSKDADDNIVHTSDYMKSASKAELHKRDQMIKSLVADLRREREDSRKKDAALRKYEGFYKEVKARSAEKARQRQLVEEARKQEMQHK